MKKIEQIYLQNTIKKYCLSGGTAIAIISSLCLLLELTLLVSDPHLAWHTGSLALGGGMATLFLLFLLGKRDYHYLRQVAGSLQNAEQLLGRLSLCNQKILTALHHREEYQNELKEAEQVAHELHKTLIMLFYCHGGTAEQSPLFRQSMRMLNALPLLSLENELLSNCREFPDSIFGTSHHIRKLDEQYERLQLALNSARLQIALAHNSIAA